MILRFLSSLRLTLALLLGVALVAVYGTVEPESSLLGGQPIVRYDLFFQSLGFRLLLGLLALNLSVCTLKTLRRNLRDRQRHLEVLGSEQVFSRPLRYVLSGHPDPEDLATALASQGYRVDLRSGRLLGQRGRLGRWGSTVVHFSVLGIMLGALTAEFGFVGTLNIHVGDSSPIYFDWEEQRDLPLGFTFRLDHFEPRYYPIELRFAAVAAEDGQVLETYTLKEGESTPLPRPGLSAQVLTFLPEEEHLILALYHGERYLGEYHTFGGSREVRSPVPLDIVLRPVAFRDPVLKQLHSEVSILEEGRVVSQGVIQVNQPLNWRGVTIYQTAYNKDRFGFWFAGFQFTKDPGEPLVWVGCVLLVAGLLLTFLVPYRAVGVARFGEETLLVALAGFRGDAGSEAFDRLERTLMAHREPTA